MKLHSKDFLSIADFSKEEIIWILKQSMDVKKNRNTKFRQALNDKVIALLFRKTSTRTRVSFEVGIHELGGYPLFIDGKTSQISKGEPAYDTAKVLSRYVHGLVIRTYEQAEIEEFAKHSSFPVINALSDDFHPCQALADYLTIIEKLGNKSYRKIVYFGDGNNVASSLFLTGSLMGDELVLCSPKGYEIPESVQKKIIENSNTYGGSFIIDPDPLRAARNADVIYTDTWTSMGQEAEKNKRLQDLKNFQVNVSVMKLAKPDAIVMHCLPAYRGEEITGPVIDGKNSVIFDQAENRLHVQKALLLALFGIIS